MLLYLLELIRISSNGRQMFHSRGAINTDNLTCMLTDECKVQLPEMLSLIERVTTRTNTARAVIYDTVRTEKRARGWNASLLSAKV